MPTLAELVAQATAHHQAGRLAAAEAVYRQAVDVEPANADLAYLLGTVVQDQGRLPEAAALLEQALRHKPNHADALNALGMILAAQGSWEQAIRRFEQALALRPQFETFAKNLHTAQAARETDLALACAARGDWQQAEQAYHRALDAEPTYVPALGNLGNALKELGKLDDAVACYRRVLELLPNAAEAHYQLGLIAQERLQSAEAAECFTRTIALEPHHVQAHYCLGTALAQQNRWAEAAVSYDRSLALTPDFAGAHLGRAFALLAQGRLAEGWPEYEWRPVRDPRRDAAGPRWDGSPLAGRTLLLRSEQGFGDHLQFVRYAERLSRDGRVIVECPPALTRLLATCPGVESVVVEGDPLPRFDVQLPLLSLSLVLGTTLENIPARVPYLAPDERSMASWRKEIGQPGIFNIGIAWQGDPAQPVEKLRGIPLAQFDNLLNIDGVRVVSLQKRLSPAQSSELASRGVADLSGRLHDFYETAAAMRALDLIITSDSAPAHLAGALGVNVWVALPFAADWRWLTERGDSPWYPTMRLFRQRRAGDWDGVFEQIAAEVARLAGDRAT